MSVPGSRYLRDIPLRSLQCKVGDEHDNLLQACYDNPLFTEDDDRNRKGSGTARGRGSPAGGGQQDGHVPAAAKDYLHPLPPGPQTVPEIRWAEKTRRRFLFKFLLACLVVVVIVALVIGLIVHFMRE